MTIFKSNYVSQISICSLNLQERQNAVRKITRPNNNINDSSFSKENSNNFITMPISNQQQKVWL